MSETIIKSIINTAIGHLRAGKLTFQHFGLDFTLSRMQGTIREFAVMTVDRSGNPLCVGHIVA